MGGERGGEISHVVEVILMIGKASTNREVSRVVREKGENVDDRGRMISERMRNGRKMRVDEGAGGAVDDDKSSWDGDQSGCPVWWRGR